MKKLRSDSTFNRLPAGQREQLLTWLFDDGMSYAAAAKRVKAEFGLAATEGSMGRFYRRAAEYRHASEMALAGGSVQDLRKAVHKLLSAATLDACRHNNNDPREKGWKLVMGLARLMMKDEQREMKEKWLDIERQRLGKKA